MDKKSGDILILEVVSACLKIQKSTLYKLDNEGKVLCQMISRH